MRVSTNHTGYDELTAKVGCRLVVLSRESLVSGYNFAITDSEVDSLDFRRGEKNRLCVFQ